MNDSQIYAGFPTETQVRLESRPFFGTKLRLSFVTELEEDEPEMNVLGSLTTLLKDLSNVKEILGR